MNNNETPNSGSEEPRPRLSWLVVVSIGLLLVSVGGIGLCQETSQPIANQPLALARYRFLKQIERQKLGTNPLRRSIESNQEVLFPLGRSDKAYLVLTGLHYIKIRDYQGDQMVCYELKGDVVKFMYSVKLVIVNKPRKDIPVTHMRDYISTKGDNRSRYVLAGHISKEAKRDLSLKQELVCYSDHPMFSALYVDCLSPSVPKSSSEREDHRQYFDSNAERFSLGETRWFETHGLPICDRELAAIKKKK